MTKTNPNSISREAQINAILEQRLALVKKIEDAEKKLEVRFSKFCSLEELGEQIVKNLNSSKVTRNLRKLNIPETKKRVQKEIEEVCKIKLRFHREALTIGVIGQARQGKSRLLQSLTGLTFEEIPDGDLGFCTGVRSDIHHKVNKQTSGIVSFYSEQEFLDEVIRPYYERLGDKPTPTSIEDFKKNPLPAPQDESSELQTMYSHLMEDYHANLDSYSNRLRGEATLDITKAEIREFVAQVDRQGDSFFEYLAVRKVDIHCEFPNSELGRITLIDMPGLGDTRLGDEERLIKALEEDIDFVLFVRKPDVYGGDWSTDDVKLYDKARESLSNLAHRSFMILNKTVSNGSNLRLCQEFEKNIKSKNIKVVQCEIADCSDKTATGEVLSQILNYLVANITRLDREYARLTQEKLEVFQQDIDNTLSEALSVLAAYDEDSLFEYQFQELWSKLTSGLEDLIASLKDQRELEESQFKTQIESTIAKCRSDKRIPSTSDIQVKKNLEESYRIAFLSCSPAIRAHLSQQFLSLNGRLQHFLEGVKIEVTRVLAEEGGLSGLSTKRGSEFLREISQLIPERRGDGQQSELRLGFQHLSAFNVSYAGIIQRQIRQHLDELTPDQSEIPTFKSSLSELILGEAIEWVLSFVLNQIIPSIDSIPLTSLPAREKVMDYLDGMLQPSELEQIVEQVLNFFSNLASQSGSIPRSKLSSKNQVVKSFHAEQIQKALNVDCDEVIDKCEQTLNGLLCEPNQIAYSMVREFVDLILRTERIEREWRIFLKREQLRVWSEFGQIIEYSEDRDKWVDLLTELREVNQLQNYYFLD